MKRKRILAWLLTAALALQSAPVYAEGTGQQGAPGGTPVETQESGAGGSTEYGTQPGSPSDPDADGAGEPSGTPGTPQTPQTPQTETGVYGDGDNAPTGDGQGTVPKTDEGSGGNQENGGEGAGSQETPGETTETGDTGNNAGAGDAVGAPADGNQGQAAPAWTLKGLIFDDEDLDGVRDEGEEPLEGVRVRLYDPEAYGQGDRTVLAEDVTEEDGTYELKDLGQGDYRVELYAPEDAGEGVAFEGNIPEEMGKWIEDGTWDYEVVLPEEETDEWLQAIPALSLTEDRELDLGLAYKAEEEPSADADKKDPSDNSQEGGNTTPEEPGTEGTEGADGAAQEKPGADDSRDDSQENGGPAGEALKKAEEETSLPMGNGALRGEENSVTAETDQTNSLINFFSNIFGKDWSYDVYYVGEDDSSDVTITEDGNLKYQVEFRNSAEIPANAVEIRIPQMLFADRYGSPVLPSEIAVPEGTPDDPTESRVSMFNYYVEGTDLVFFNYGELDAGTSSAFQVLYRNLDMMQIEDGTAWSLQSSCTVAGGEGEDPSTGEAEALTGTVNTSVILSGVTMTPYVIDGKSYSPGLYTEDQIERIINGSLPDEYQGDKFHNYRYVVWDVKVYGSATQPWEMYVKDIPSFDPDGDGTIVGFSAPAEEAGEPYDGYYKVEIPDVKMDRLNDSFRIVTAYPADKVNAGVQVRNNISVSLHPVDGLDQDKVKSSESSWTWADYEWTYEGNKIGMDKRVSGKDTYASWLNVYKAASAAGEDKGDFRFNISSFVRGYEDTHITTNGETMGDLIEGKSYEAVTVDDFVYAYPNTNGISQSDYEVLDGNDYYFTSVRVTQTDQGYDPWEDSYAAPEEPAVGDVPEKGLVIYAMFADTATDADPDAWEQVAVVPWSENGTMTYQFTDEQIARMPWRVKAVHRTTNYRTDCDIDLTMTIRHDSDTFQKMVNGIDYSDKGQKQSLTVENISGVTGQIYEDGTAGGFMLIDNEGNYQEPGLEDATKEMYGTLPMRGNDLLYFSSLQEHGQAGKSGTTWNDVVNGRVHLTYNLTAYDGYNVYDDEAISYLKSEGVQSPGRNEVVFYDVLPYGVKFDPSVGVTAGRITSLSGDSYQNYPQSWDQSQVQVTVDSEKDIDTDYKGTGRTMVRFHITYTGADPAVYTDQMWMAGFGISFGAYYDWKDTDVADNASNVAAYMAEGDDQRPFLGTADEVAQDNGRYPSSLGGDTEDYTVFGKDIDGDGDETDTVLYAKTKVSSDSAQAATSGIRKLVRADADRFGLYREQAEVDLGKGYTYDITVSNVSGTMSDIVVFDRLDNGAADDSALSGSGSWQGTFRSVVTTGLEQTGAAPVIYYNAERNAAVPADGQNPNEVLTADNGWMTAEAWAEAGKEAADVKAVAVDIRKTKDGGEFALTGTASVTFQIQMTSPEKDTGLKAYNAAGYYSSNARGVSGYTVSDTTEVSQHIPGQFELVKEFTGEVPDAVKDSGFVFTVYRKQSGQDKEAYANLEYELYQKDGNGQWIRQGENQVYATDGAGQLTLKAGQKAVFDTPEARLLSAEEEENPFWEPNEQTTHPDQDTTVQTVANRYRPVLYVTKSAASVPSGTDIGEDTFTFRLEADGKAVADTEFWYVDGPRTDGGIPEKVTGLGKDGEGKTDGNGEFTLHAGETVALFPGNEGTAYTVTETAGYGDGTDWICEEPEMSGTLPYTGTAAEITNIYKWKDLYLTKELTNQDPSECTEEFTFRITDEDGEPVSGKTWVMAESGDAAELTGKTDKNGEFSAACAGRTIRIEDLEGGVTYIVEEIDNTGYEDGDYYEPVNKKAEAVMPVYGLSASVTITNDYILRPLSVTKTVTYGADATEEEIAQIKEKEFTMTAEVDGRLLADTAYTVEENGKVVEADGETNERGEFLIKDGQTVVFDDVAPKGSSYTVTETPDRDYPQIFPAEGEPAEGTFGENGAEARIINGQGGTLIIGKEYIASDSSDEIAAEYVDKLKGELRNDGAVTLTFEKLDSGTGAYGPWTDTDAEILVIDMLDNTVAEETWDGGRTTFQAEPWVYYCITGLEPTDQYRVSEAAEMQHRIINYTGDDNLAYMLEIGQKIPANDKSFEGTLENAPAAVFYNEVKSLKEVSSAVKVMLSEENPVPENAQLAYRVERYDGTVWNPAANIPYIVQDNAGFVSDRVEKTGADGMIYLYKTADGMPKVSFTEDDVKVHPKNPAAGMLRVVEVAEQTDASWGRFAGYVSEYGEKSVAVWDGIGFANSNTTHEFEIEKRMENPTDDTFTMIIRQITGADESPVQYKDQIRETVPGSGLVYTVYDAETDGQVRTGVTGSSGEIDLKANQYAKVTVEDGTEWTVSEKIPGGYTLEDLTGEAGDGSVSTGKLDDNMMAVSTEKPRENLEGITLTQQMVRAGSVINADTGEEVKLTEGKVVIPEKILVDGERYYVTKIGDYAFGSRYSMQYSNLTEVILPDTVEVIGEYAFSYLQNLKSVYIPSSVKRIEQYAFAFVGYNYFDMEIEYDQDDPGLVLGMPASYEVIVNPCDAGFDVPGSVEYVGECAFGYSAVRNADLRNIDPNELGIATFLSCYYLETCQLPDTTEVIPLGTFTGCLSLKVEFPEKLRSIGEQAYRLCGWVHPIDSTKLPETVTEIGDMGFVVSRFVDNEFVMPENLTSIGDQGIACCGLESLVWNEQNVQMGEMAIASNKFTVAEVPEGVSFGPGMFAGCQIEEVVWPEGITEIPESLFTASGLKEIEIPDTVTSIGDGAFGYCTGLTEITIPDNVTSIGENAFEGCSGLEEVQLPEGLNSIGDSAFERCTSLTSVEIPEGVTEWPDSLFEGCTSLAEINIPDTVTSLGSDIFSDCTALTSMTLPDGVKEIPYSLFNGCTSLQEIEFAEDITEIGSYAFSGTAITDFTVPATVTTMENGVFQDCTSLGSVTINADLTGIGTYTFDGCTSLTSVNIPDTVTKIGYYAFRDCTSLERITIPASVTSMGYNSYSGYRYHVFDGCTSLDEILILGDKRTIGGENNKWYAPNATVIWEADQ